MNERVKHIHYHNFFQFEHINTRLKSIVLQSISLGSKKITLSEDSNALIEVFISKYDGGGVNS